jgi:NAD(P)-dependent dehydrogenase (short-subunit alcohol dehydrogenase family)
LASHAIITGASGGIGGALACAFRAAGWSTIGIDVRAEPKAQCDRFLLGSVSDPALGARVLETLQSEEATECCLINNAAQMLTKPFVETTQADWDALISTNLTGVFVLTKALVPVLSGGSILNIASVHARATSAGTAAYAASKGGLVALTKGLAIELAEHGIRANSILPGAIGTEMLRDSLSDEAALQALQDSTPLRRIGEPEDIAHLALFLADRVRAANITGQEFVCDGGALARLATS